MTTLKTKTTEPKLFSFIISPEMLKLNNDKGEFLLNPRGIPQSVCNVIAFDLEGASGRVTEIINGKELQAKYTNVEPLAGLLKMAEDNFVEAAVPVEQSPQVDPPIQVSGENWLKYLKDEAKKVGYQLRKKKIC